MEPRGVLVVGILIAVAVVAVVPAILLWFYRVRPPRGTAAEVEKAIEDFLEGRGGRWDWDDFISLRQDDPALEAIRLECGQLPDKYPPGNSRHYCGADGLARLREMLKMLRTDRDGAGGGAGGS